MDYGTVFPCSLLTASKFFNADLEACHDPFMTPSMQPMVQIAPPCSNIPIMRRSVSHRSLI